jgi:hypothetical protein
VGVFVGCFDGYRMVVFVVVVVLILLSVFLLEMRDMMGIICNNGPLLFLDGWLTLPSTRATNRTCMDQVGL